MFLFMSSIFFCFSIVCSVGSVLASASGINHPREIAQILFPCDTWDKAPNALQWDCEQCSSCRLCGQEAEAMSVYIWLRGRFISRAFSCWPSASTPYLLSCWSCLQMWWKSFETDFFLTDIWQIWQNWHDMLGNHENHFGAYTKKFQFLLEASLITSDSCKTHSEPWVRCQRRWM